jgi:iron(III) transport system substrate-binding protein
MNPAWHWLNGTSRALILALSVAAVTAAQAQDTSLLASTAPDRAQKLEAAARKEGALSFYTSIAQKDLDPLIAPFEKKYGIKVTTWRASGDLITQRILQESGAGRHTVDAVHVASTEMEALAREKVLEKVESPYYATLTPGSVPAHKLWVSTLLSPWVQAYNVDAVKKSELPKTYQDLLDPKWKGKLGYEVQDIEWFITVSKLLGDDKGVQFFKDLVKKNGLSVRKGHTLLDNLVAAGEVPLALTLYNYMPAQAKAQGAPVDWFVIEPAVARANGIGVVKGAAHPNAAALFEDYLLSEAQPILASLDYVPVSSKVESPFKGVKLQVFDPAEVLDHADKWQPLYDRIIVKGDGN